MKNKFVMMLLSVVIAFSLWVYVVLVVSPESEATYQNIPVVLDGTAMLADRNLMIISDTNLRVDLKLSGNRQDLNKLDNTNITLLADLSQITQPGEYDLKYSVYYPGTVQSGTIEVLEKEPQHMTIVVAERSQKAVPVKLNYVGSVPENFVADMANAVIDHSTITVSGPKDIVDQIEYARVAVNLNGRTTDIEQIYAYTLCDKKGETIQVNNLMTVSTTEVQVYVKVNQIKEVSLVYDVIPGGGITADMVTITPQNETRTWITVSGNKDVLSGLDTLYLGAIDLGELTKNGFVTFTVQLPEGVENISGYWEVAYYVEMPAVEAVETREFKVTTFRTENVPDGRQVQIKNEELTVLLRGPVDVLNQLSAENIVAVLDCNGQNLTDNSNCYLHVNILVMDSDGNVLENVGAVREDGRTYTVLAYVGMVESEE